MMEAGVVIDINGNPMFWHTPHGRNTGALPDSMTLWEVMWDAFKLGTLLGFAHSHPGQGVPGPSYTDVTTFAAVEAALGKRLTWWITSSDHVVSLTWTGPHKYTYSATTVTEALSWVAELRRLSEEQGR
jgi:hypothetical protein